LAGFIYFAGVVEIPTVQVFVHTGAVEIPTELIKKRWMINAREGVDCFIPGYSEANV
jgi:hypothetical protein